MQTLHWPRGLRDLDILPDAWLRKKTAFPGWTLPGVCIGALAGIFCLLTLRLKLTHYDNFSHWALIVKYLLLVEELPGAESTMIPFRDYPPGVGLIIYYICRYAGHSQGMMLLAQNGVLFACFFALAGIVEEKRRFLLYSLLGAGCAMLFYLNLTIRINNLLVDFLLPLLALASMAYSCREREKFRLCLGQSLLLGFTGIVKGTGTLFCRRGRCVCLLAAGAEGKRKRRAKISSVGISRTNSGSDWQPCWYWQLLWLRPFCCGRIMSGQTWPGLKGNFRLSGTRRKRTGEELYGQIALGILSGRPSIRRTGPFRPLCFALL